MVSSEGRCGVSIDQRLPPSGRKRPRKRRSQAVELTWPRWPPVCLWKSLYLQQMTHHGNLCCSAAAVLLLTYDSHFSSPPDFVFFLWFSNTSSVSSPFLFHLLSSVSLHCSSSFALCLFPAIFHLSGSVCFCVSPCFPHSSSLSYFLCQLLSRFQSVIGLLARLPAFTTCLLCVRTCTTGSNRIPRMCVSSPAR